MPLSVSFWLSVGAVTCLIVWYRYVPLSIIDGNIKNYPEKCGGFACFICSLGSKFYSRPFSFSFNGLALNGFLAI
ncbi:MAG: hypothetical protein ACLS9P_01335 [Haemophilus parainfluenzae]